MKSWVIGLSSIALAAGGLLGAAPAQASVAQAVNASAPAVKCINLKTGVSRNLAGKKCPRGWAREASPVWIKKRNTFLAEVRDSEASLWAYDDDDLFNVGKATCQLLDEGGSFGDIVDAVVESDIDSGEAAAIIVNAVYYLCPGHKAFLNAYVDTL